MHSGLCKLSNVVAEISKEKVYIFRFFPMVNPGYQNIFQAYIIAINYIVNNDEEEKLPITLKRIGQNSLLLLFDSRSPSILKSILTSVGNSILFGSIDSSRDCKASSTPK